MPRNYTYNGSLLKKQPLQKPKEEEKEPEVKLFQFDYMPALLHPWQVAEILGVTVRTLGNYRILGRIKAVWVSSRKYLYKKEDVEAFINENRLIDPFAE